MIYVPLIYPRRTLEWALSVAEALGEDQVSLTLILDPESEEDAEDIKLLHELTA